MKKLLLLPLLALTIFGCTTNKSQATTEPEQSEEQVVVVEVPWTEIDIANGYGLWVVQRSGAGGLKGYYPNNYQKLEFYYYAVNELTDLRIRMNDSAIDRYYGTSFTFAIYKFN